MKSKDTYIKVTEDNLDDIPEPTESQLMLDTGEDLEYTSPYSDSYDDLFDVGGVIEAGGIFDDR